MRVTVLVGSDRLRVPVDEGSKTMSWLQAEIVRRWERSHPGEFLRISELRTADNVRLDNEDQVFEVCREDESLIAVLGTGTEKEVGPGDMVKQYYLMNLIGEGTFGRGEHQTLDDRARIGAAGQPLCNRTNGHSRVPARFPREPFVRALQVGSLSLAQVARCSSSP